MVTIVARTLVALLAITQIPLTTEVFAQSESTEDVATDESVQTLEESLDSFSAEQWYTIERISGNIEVGDFVVGPGRSEVTARPGETVTVNVSVTNRIVDGTQFFLEVEDVEGTQSGDSMTTVPENRKSPIGISDFISFPEDNLTLNLGERARIPVTITVPENTSPGGYFGAVMVSTVRVSGQQPDSELIPSTPIIARVASLIFLTVEGEYEEAGEVVSIDTVNKPGWWYEKGPVEFGILYENTGTVHLNPYGEVSIYNLLGEEVGYLQLEPWFVLPKALRLREFSWDREFLFGRYTVEAKINRGYDDQVDTLTTSFWVLPWKLVGGIFLTIFIIIFAVRTFFRTFEFKRKDS